MSQTKVERINWIDHMKAFAIILVVIGHFPIEYELKKYIYSFHIPLFFMLSGLVFNCSKYSEFKKFLIHKCKTILAPYLCLNFSYFVFWVVYYRVLAGSKKYSLFDLVRGVIYANSDQYHLINGPTWFLPTLFLIEVSAYLLVKYFKDDSQLLLLASGIFLVWGYIENVAKKNLFTPWHLNSVPVALAIFMIGYLCKDYLQKCSWINQKKLANIGYAIIILVIGMYISMTNGRVSFGGNKYHSMIYTLIAILSNCSGYLILITNITAFKPIDLMFRHIGKNTLFILGFHKMILLLIKKYDESLLNTNLKCIIFSLVSVAVLSICAIGVNKKVPFILGKTTKGIVNKCVLVLYSIICLILIFKYYI